SLVALYERLNDVDGITRALEGLASITHDPKARATVLRRLGDHYAYCAKDDERAQRCWLEVAAILPDDLSVQTELNGIHRRRGDFAALDDAQTRQLWRTTDLKTARYLAREVAHNLDENLNEPAKSHRAWLHVLALESDADDALRVLSDRLSATDTTEVHAILESRLSIAIQNNNNTDRNEIGLAIARLWEQRGDKSAALAAYERVRAWSPCDNRVVDPLIHLHGPENASAATSILEIASAHADSADAARSLIERITPLIREDQQRQRFFLLHRLLRFDPSAGLECVVDAATSASAWKDLAALYERLAESADSPEMRRAFRIQLASVCEEGLSDPHRAFIALQSLVLTNTADDDILALARLAESTGRWEDLLAVLDATLLPNTPPIDRQKVLLQRAEICQRRINDHHRAFLELQRLVQGRESGELDDVETQALVDMDRIAIEHGLVHELESVYGELWDKAPNDNLRVTVARARQCIRRDHLNDPSGAVEQALLVLRLRPHDESVAQEVLEASETLGLWERTIPVLEGVWRAQGDNPSKLKTLAQLYRDRCGQPTRSAELYAEALRMAPHDDDALDMLEALGETTGLWSRVVLAIRIAAARAGGTTRGKQLALRAAKLYAEKLGDTDSSLDAHKWILQIWPDEVDSLETVINAHRDAATRDPAQHLDHRARLQQWIDRVQDPAKHAERWLEIGKLCRDHLDDPAGALVAFSTVNEMEPSNEEAADALRLLGNVSLPTALRTRQLRMELRRPATPRRAELLNTLARLEQEMGQPDAAIEALRELFSLENGKELAFAPLAALLTETKKWEALATLEEDAAVDSAPGLAISHLHAALRIAEEHLGLDADCKERLLRKILVLAPEDADAFTRLARLLRDAGRLDELTAELRQRLEHHSDKHHGLDHQAMLRELIRLCMTVKKDVDYAEKLIRAGTSSGSTPGGMPDPDNALWLSMLAARNGDHSRYLDQRRIHMAKLPSRLGALVV
ncbi:MAG: hypothetical protein FWD57_15645, partial [Polyangiaceae bacterium]|nr:hypothetical protein [Polyangiaceae bacterium]